MRNVLVGIVSSALILSATGQAQAFTRRATGTVPVGTSGVTAIVTLAPPVVVTQATADTQATLGFGTSTDLDFRDSNEAIKVDVSTNVANNRLLIHTSNLRAGADPQYCLSTGEGVDGGGLVGIGPDNCDETVPLIWGIADTNVNYVFTAATGFGATNGVFVVDTAHVTTFVDAVINGASDTDKNRLDTLLMKTCVGGAVVDNPAAATGQPRVYPQFFGAENADQDLCSAEPSAVTINGTTIQPGALIPYAQELSKNIAVVAFGFGTVSGFGGNTGLAPNLATTSTTDTINVTSPFYLPMAADFRAGKGGLNYTTNTLEIELVSQ